MQPQKEQSSQKNFLQRRKVATKNKLPQRRRGAEIGSKFLDSGLDFPNSIYCCLLSLCGKIFLIEMNLNQRSALFVTPKRIKRVS